MDLREATMVVIADILNDNNGNLGIEEVSSLSPQEKLRLARKLMKSDALLQEITNALEVTIGEHIENAGDEYEQ